MEQINAISWQTVIERLEEIRLNLQNCFVNPSLDAQFELSKLSQVGSVLNYQLEFENLSSRATETPESILVSLFISGLKPEIRRELQLNRPSALKEAFASARYHESRLKDLKHEVTEVEDESKLMVNKVDVELPGVESEAEVKEVEDELTSSAVETETIENIANGSYCKMDETIIEFTMPFEAVKGEKVLSCADIAIVDTTLLTDSFTCIYPTCIYPTANLIDKGRTEVGGVWKLGEFSEFAVFVNEDGIMHVAKSSNIIQEKTPVARRMVVFKFYALKEVYQKPFDCHLEDKVDLKESGMIRMLVIIFYIIYIS